MNILTTPKAINDAATAADKTCLEISEQTSKRERFGARIIEAEAALNELDEYICTTHESWCNQVVQVGMSLAAHKAQNNDGWKKKYDSFGFDFNYSQARKYMACADVREVVGIDIRSIDEWARAANKFLREKQDHLKQREQARQLRLDKRKEKEQYISGLANAHSDNSVEYLEGETNEADDDLPPRVPSSTSKARMLPTLLQAVYRDLCTSIMTDERYFHLRLSFTTFIDFMRMTDRPSIPPIDTVLQGSDHNSVNSGVDSGASGAGRKTGSTTN